MFLPCVVSILLFIYHIYIAAHLTKARIRVAYPSELKRKANQCINAAIIKKK